jgi:hypothetical protein
MQWIGGKLALTLCAAEIIELPGVFVSMLGFVRDGHATHRVF